MFTDQRGVLLCWEPSSWSLQPAAWTGHVRALSFCMDRGKNSVAVLPPHATTWKSCWMGFLFSLILSQPWNIAVLSTGIHTAFCGIAGEGSVELKSCLTDCLCVKCIYLPCLPALHSLGHPLGGITVPPCTWSCCCRGTKRRLQSCVSKCSAEHCSYPDDKSDKKC